MVNKPQTIYFTITGTSKVIRFGQWYMVFTKFADGSFRQMNFATSKSRSVAIEHANCLSLV